MWFKIDSHELAVFIALEGEPMGDWERDMYVAARRQAEAMISRSVKRRLGTPNPEVDCGLPRGPDHSNRPKGTSTCSGKRRTPAGDRQS